MARTLQGESMVPSANRVPGRRPRADEYRRALQRVEAKQQIIADLIEGRLTLLEATARFREAHLGSAGEGAYGRLLATAGSEDGEHLVRAVIGWVHLALRDRPERAEALSEELEQQLQAHLATHGVVRLPRA
jgi:hypothetical protein